MPQIGPLEVVVVGAIALIVFGPQRLPEIARTVGRALGQLRQMAAEVRTEFESGMNLDDIADEPEDIKPEDTKPEPEATQPEPEATQPEPEATQPAEATKPPEPE